MHVVRVSLLLVFVVMIVCASDDETRVRSLMDTKEVQIKARFANGAAGEMEARSHSGKKRFNLRQPSRKRQANDEYPYPDDDGYIEDDQVLDDDPVTQKEGDAKVTTTEPLISTTIQANPSATSTKAGVESKNPCEFLSVLSLFFAMFFSVLLFL